MNPGILINPFHQYIEIEANLFTKPEKVIPTFSPELNRQFTWGGIEKGRSIMIGAKFYVGKTYFALNWARYLIERKYRVHFFSLDMDFKRIFIRLLRQVLSVGEIAAIDKWKEDTAFVREKLTDAGYFDYLKIYTNEKKPILFNEITYIVEQEKPDIVFVDHFGKLQGMGRSIYEETAGIAEYFRAKKTSLNTVFAVLVQMRKEHHRTRLPNAIPPQADDYKGAGNIGEDADVLLSLARPDLDKECEIGHRGMIVGSLRKNRLSDNPEDDYIYWGYSKTTTIMTDV